MMEDSGIIATGAVISNGSFGKRIVRFETGHLAKQAAGSVLAYLDGEATVLPATAVGRSPEDQLDLFPLTVNVEERVHAAGRVPDSSFRREGHVGTRVTFAARLTGRPLRPGFIKDLRNGVQVVRAVLTVRPGDAYDALAINAASTSTRIVGLPSTGLVGGTRFVFIDGQ